MVTSLRRCLIIALVLILPAVAWAGGGSEQAGTEEDGPLTLTYFSFNSDVNASWEGPVYEAISDKTGVELEMEFLVGTDLMEKVGIMIAGEEYADIINARGLNVPERLISAGALLPLGDLLESHGPTLTQLWGESLGKLRHPDGNIYYLASPRNRPEDIQDMNQGLLVQYDVLEKTGWPKPETLDDVRNMLEAYLEQVPDLDGQSFVPWGLWADSWGYNITVNNASLWVNGFTDDSDAYVDQETYDVTYYNTTEYFKRYLAWLNEMYLADLLDPNGFILKNDAWRSLVASGRVLAMITGTWDINESERALRQAGVPERAYARFPVVYEEGIKDRSQVYAESYSWGLTISKNNPNPEKTMEFFDFLASDEGTVLLNWGVQGQHYDVVDGERVMKPEIMERYQTDPDYGPDQGFGTFQWVQYEGAIRLDDGQYASPFNPEQAYEAADEWTRTAMDEYGIRYWGEHFDTTGEAPPYGFAWTIPVDPQSDGALAYAKANEIRHAMVPQIVTSRTPAEFESRWEEFVSELYDVAGIAAWEEEMSQGIKERLDIWGLR
jgi:putative aldouronate transport system substrate-binding protein